MVMEQNESTTTKHFSNSLKNLTGTFFYFFCQWLMLILVIRIAGFEVSGEFVLVTTLTNPFGILSAFCIRSYQLSDINRKFYPQQYTGAYLITCAAALLCFLAVLSIIGYNKNVSLCCFVYIFFKLCETFSVYIITYMQIENKYTKITVSYILKGIIPLAGFSLCLFFMHDLLLSILIMTILFLLIVLFYDLSVINLNILHGVMIKDTGKIIKSCIPLVLSSLFLPYCQFLMRYNVEKIYGMEKLGYFSAMTMVILIINIIAGSVFIVIIPVISKNYLENNKKNLVKILLIILGIIFIMVSITILLAVFTGDMIFSLVFGIEILPYMYLLIPVIIASAFLVISGLLNTFLNAIYKRINILICMTAGALTLTIIIIPATKIYGMSGNIYSFIISVIIINILQIIFIIYNIVKLNKIKKIFQFELIDNEIN